MSALKQKSSGDHSPNIAIGALYAQMAPQAPRGREVLTMVQIIKYLSNNSLDISYSPDDGYKKAFNEKLSEYPAIDQLINNEFIELSVLYENAYGLGWAAEDVGEIMKTKIALHLRARSVDLLLNAGDNPQLVIEKLCNELHPAFSDGDFDESAVRFFVLRQFLECNVLPVGAA